MIGTLYLTVTLLDDYTPDSIVQFPSIEGSPLVEGETQEKEKKQTREGPLADEFSIIVISP